MRWTLNIVSLSDTIEGSYHSWDLYTTGQLVDGLQQKKRKPVFIKWKWNHVFSRVTILSFHPVGKSMCSEELVEKLQPPVSHQPESIEEAVLWCGSSFANWEVENLHQVKGKLNQTSYHSILLYYTIPSGMRLVGQGFVLMQDNDPKHTSKLCQRYI